MCAQTPFKVEIVSTVSPVLRPGQFGRRVGQSRSNQPKNPRLLGKECCLQMTKGVGIGLLIPNPLLTPSKGTASLPEMTKRMCCTVYIPIPALFGSDAYQRIVRASGMHITYFLDVTHETNKGQNDGR